MQAHGALRCTADAAGPHPRFIVNYGSTTRIGAARGARIGADAIHSSYASSVLRSRSSRSWTVIGCLALVLGTSACERGCLSKWLSDRSETPAVGGESPRGSGSRDAGGGAFDLGGTDCSDGLARCVDGRVEVSLAAHVTQAECPWQNVGTCPSGCVTSGLEVVATADVARVQLCKAEEPLLRPVLPSETSVVTICADEGVTCADAVVRTCAVRGQPARLVSACVSGCASGIGVEPGDVLTSDGAAAILCRRAHAERR